MPQGTVRRHWPWGAALVVPALALAWLALPADSGPKQAGLVQIAESLPLPVPSPAAPAAPPLTPERNAAMAVESGYLVAREARDSGWAGRSETLLTDFMRRIGPVEARSLQVKCTTSVCEVSGVASEDGASGSMGPAWTTMERETGSPSLRTQGLERAATSFGTGRVREAFEVYYRRIHSTSAQ